MLSLYDLPVHIIRCQKKASDNILVLADDAQNFRELHLQAWLALNRVELGDEGYERLISCVVAFLVEKIPLVLEPLAVIEPDKTPRWKQIHAIANTDLTCTLVFTDVTSWVEQQQQANQQLHFLATLHDQIPDMFYYKDRQSRYLGGNREWYRHHGAQTLADILGKTDLDSPCKTPQEWQQIFSEEQHLMETGGLLRRQEEVKDPTTGNTRFFESLKATLFNEKQEIIGLVGLTRDITNQVAAEAAAIRARADAEQALKAKSSFLAVMSHEIRTPMNGVIGCTSLLANTALSEEQQNLVNTIQNCGEGLLVIINDILDYSKIEAGHLTLEYSPFYLRPLIEECIELFSKQVIDKRLELNYYILPDVPYTLFGDANRIRQVINNLLGNAVKFTDRGEIYIEVSATSLDIHAHQCKLQIAIRDTGIGIPREGQAKIFSAFTQADSSITRKYGGTGLGLVICRKIVQHMGGDIWFKSVPGTGTTFYFSMTLAYDPANMQESLPPEWVELNDLQVLIVDDNSTNRKVLSNTLIQWGMKPSVFDSPKSALENVALGHRYDLVLLDFCMPHMDGAELASHIKSYQHLSLVPIVLLSSVQQERHLDLFKATLLKPVRNSTLKRTLLQVMGAQVVQISQERINEDAQKKHTRILVVEDNTVNQMVVTMMLKKLGYTQVVTVADGVEAVAICQQQTFDIILMDIQMEQMDGYTASRKIREHLASPDRPWIIALTAGAQQEDADKAYAAGMNAFTTKPIQIGGLKQVIEEGEDKLRVE